MIMFTAIVYLLSLSLITLFNLGTAQHLPARVQAPATTPAHLFIRQEASDNNASCVAGATSCNDGQPGCCAIGQSCAFDSSHRPVCAGSCSGGVNCSGDMSGLCCDSGQTCNMQLTLCEATDLAMTSMSLTGPVQTEMSTVVATTVVTSSSQLMQASTAAPTGMPTSQAMPSAAVNTALQASSTTTAGNFLPAPSETYNNSTSLSSSFPEPGLEFTYTTVFVTDSSSSSSSRTPSSNSGAGDDQVTKTVTTIVRSGQEKGYASGWKVMLAGVLTSGVMVF